MVYLVWSGAAVSAIGLFGIVFSIVAVAKARRAGLDDAGLRDRVAKILPVNLGSLFLSVIGLMMVVIGVLLA